MTALTTPPAGEEGETPRELAQRVIDTWGDGNPPIVILARALLSSPRAEEVRRMREALRQLELNESELWGIRDDYIEAQHSGVYNGKRIKPEAARQYARDFGERADSAKQCADIVRASLSPQGG